MINDILNDIKGKKIDFMAYPKRIYALSVHYLIFSEKGIWSPGVSWAIPGLKDKWFVRLGEESEGRFCLIVIVPRNRIEFQKSTR
jgi:hypothetical protein